MEHGTRDRQHAQRPERVSLGELIHQQVRVAVEQAAQEELAALLDAALRAASDAARLPQRAQAPHGDRADGAARPDVAPSPRVHAERAEGVGVDRRPALPAPAAGGHHRRGDDLPGRANTRRLKGALRPLLKAAPLSRSAASRIVGTLKGALDTLAARSLAAVDVVYVYLDAIALRIRCAGKVGSTPVLAAVGVLADDTKQLLALELCGGESADAWQGFVDGLVARGLRAPLLCIIDGTLGLRRAVARGWSTAAVQRGCVHKLRNLQAKAPAHARADVTADFHRIVYAESAPAARAAYTRFERAWAKRCPGVVRSLQEGGAELLTVFDFPREQWKTLRTTNVIERLNEEFRRRVKTQGSLPGEDAALLLLYSLVATGQITLRKLDGHEKMAALIRARVTPAA
jgi:putative transposase